MSKQHRDLPEDGRGALSPGSRSRDTLNSLWLVCLGVFACIVWIAMLIYLALFQWKALLLILLGGVVLTSLFFIWGKLILTRRLDGQDRISRLL